jgi:hypothetical protein
MSLLQQPKEESKLTMTRHDPVITATLAGCTCGRWGGPTRIKFEPQGTYTIRAHECHRAHVACVRAQPVQQSMFEPPGLFEE